MGSALLPARGCRPGGRVWAPVWHGRTVLAPSTWSPGHALEDLSLRERTLWRMHYETAARSARGARARRRGRGPGRTGRPGSGKIGGIDVIIWRTGTARLLPRLLKGRKSGPVVITERKARVQLPATGLGPAAGPGSATSRPPPCSPGPPAARPLHQLRRSVLTYDAGEGTGTLLLMARSGHTSVRSLARYARVSADALARTRPSTTRPGAGDASDPP